MGFFSKLFGGGDEDAAAAAATSEYLSTAATRAGVFDAKLEPVDGAATTLRGTLRGLPFYLRCEHQGGITDLVIHHAHVDRDELDLAVLEDAEITGTDEPGFLALAAPLQRRILDALRSGRIRELGADATEVEVCFLVPRPDRLAEDLVLAIDVALARGATKPASDDAEDDDDHDDEDEDEDEARDPYRPPFEVVEETEEQKTARDLLALATKIAARIPGARVVEFPGYQAVDVRWSIDGIPVRLVCDARAEDLDLHVQCLGTGVTFELEAIHPDTVELLDLTRDDEWDDTDGHYPIGHGLYVRGGRRRVLRQEQLLRKIAPADLEALARALTDDDVLVLLDEDEVLRSRLCNLADVDDAWIAKALTLASLYAKVAAALVK